MSDKIIHRGETMLISISADNFPITDLSDVVLTIKHGQTEQQLHLEDFTLVTNPDTQITAQSCTYWYAYVASTTMTDIIKIYGIKVA